MHTESRELSVEAIQTLVIFFELLIEWDQNENPHRFKSTMELQHENFVSENNVVTKGTKNEQ